MESCRSRIPFLRAELCPVSHPRTFPQGFHIALCQQDALFQQGNVLAEQLCILHIGAAQKQGDALFLGHTAHQRLNGLQAFLVHAAGRLIRQQDLGTVHQRTGQGSAAEHPCGEALYQQVSPLPNIQLMQKE